MPKKEKKEKDKKKRGKDVDTSSSEEEDSNKGNKKTKQITKKKEKGTQNKDKVAKDKKTKSVGVEAGSGVKKTRRKKRETRGHSWSKDYIDSIKNENEAFSTAIRSIIDGMTVDYEENPTDINLSASGFEYLLGIFMSTAKDVAIASQTIANQRKRNTLTPTDIITSTMLNNRAKKGTMKTYTKNVFMGKKRWYDIFPPKDKSEKEEHKKTKEEKEDTSAEMEVDT
jgi:hypothetical protein